MKQIFENARQVYATLKEKASAFLDKDDVKSAADLAKAAGLVAATALFVTGALGGLVSGGLAFVPLLAAAGLVSYIYSEDAVKRVRHGKEEITWTNDAGQKVKSTVGQKMDLDAAQRRIYNALSYAEGGDAQDRQDFETSAKKISAKFARVAARVSLVEDIAPPAGKFTFARKGPGLPLGL